MNTARDGCLGPAACPNSLTFLSHDRRSAGILAERQHAGARDIRIAQHGQCDHPIVLARTGIIEDRCNLAKMRVPQEKVDVMKRLAREQGQSLWFDTKYLAAIEFLHRNMLAGHQTIFRRIGTELEQFLEGESWCGHERREEMRAIWWRRKSKV